MKKTHFRPTVHAALMSLVLGCSTVWAQNALPVFVQGSEVNLRGAPSTSAEVVKKVTIGTECISLGEAAKQWVRLKCGDVEGFTLKTLVGPDKPKFETLLAQAQAPQTDVKLRLDAAARAATLNPQSEPALELLADLFFEANFKQLAKDTKKGGLRETFVATCNDEFASPKPVRKHEDCLTTELEKIEYDWHQLRFQGREFVSAMFREGSLFVYTGHISKRPGKGRFNDGDDDFNIIIESRSNSPVAEPVKNALLKKAISSSTRDEQRPQDEPKYSSWAGESADMPVLDPASLLLYRTLPPTWRRIQQNGDAQYVRSTCGVVDVLLLRLDVHRRASLFYSQANGPDNDVTFTRRVLHVTQQGLSYRLQTNNKDEGGDDLVLVDWPTPQANVSKWKGERLFGSTVLFALPNAKNIEFRERCQDAG